MSFAKLSREYRLGIIIYLFALLHAGGTGQLPRYLAGSRALLAGDGFNIAKHLRADNIVDILHIEDKVYTGGPPGIPVILTIPLLITRLVAERMETRCPQGFNALLQIIFIFLIAGPLLASTVVSIYRLCMKLSGDESKAFWTKSHRAR